MTCGSPSFSRRLVLQGAGSVALVGLGFGTVPAVAAANDKYPEDAFRQKGDADAIKALYGKTAEASDKVKLDAPEIAENGAVVPIAVATALTAVTSISFLVSENPNALAAFYVIPEGTVPAVANRLKMAKTCNVIAIVESAGKLYSATKEVKVTVGGCGG
ncbi:MAG: thiosulfate oxidation carrier protein SoxY [Bradyrhizobium sp.]|nr:thiosulfate oxidation carrier protein SoxY [Bradyrhizobium sp.]